jgi:prolyl-tRNA editing enzyme YbaK/EbsC (Cys-tRNA(Pro) deacylase)
LATEAEMEEQFPGFELGSVPPIEEVAGAPVYVDRHLLDRDDVVFAAGTHTESVKVRASALQLLGRHASVEVCRAPRERPVDLGMR